MCFALMLRPPADLWVLDCPSELPSSLIPVRLSCFLWSEASQSCVLNPVLGLYSLSGQPLFCGFDDYHLLNVFWPVFSGPVSSRAVTSAPVGQGSCPNAETHASLQGKASFALSSLLSVLSTSTQSAEWLVWCLHCS